MHKKAISVLSIVMVICMCLMTPFTVNAKNIEITKTGATSGTTGDCTWSLDGTVLTISGNGKMGDYSWIGGPWGFSVTKVIIENGVTSIGANAFSFCENLTCVTIGNSVMSIGYKAFYDCTGLTSVTIPDSVTVIESAAFYCCMAIKRITLGNHVSSIGDVAFNTCSSLTN